jgi:Ribosomal protein S4E
LLKKVNLSYERFDQVPYLIELYFGFADVVTIEKTGEYFRLIYDVKGRFTIHRITAEEAKVN